MSSKRHSDIELRCACCGKGYVFSAGEQELNAVRGVAREGDRIILVLDSERLCEGSAHLRLPNQDEEAREAHG